MQKNVTGQKLIVFAFDSTTNVPKTGDAANLTAYVSKDYGAVTVLTDTTATEMDATNAKGYYLFDLTQAETNADTLLFSAKSATANIVVVGVPATVFTTAPNFSLASIDASGRVDVIKVAGTTQTAGDIIADTNDIQARLPAALGANGNIKADVRDFNGTAGTFTVAGKPDVTLANGAHGGTSATLRLGGSTTTPALYVTNSGGDAVQFESTGGNGFGMDILGNGTGAGWRTTGGATGNGFYAIGGATSGSGGVFEGQTDGSGFVCTANGVSRHGWMSVVNGTGHGWYARGGATSGDGARLEAATLGHGLNCIGLGSDQHGLLSTGGTAGTSDGIKAVAGTGGVPIRGNITGDITGNLSGSVGSVTGAVGSVTGNVGGNVTGSVGSVAAGGITAASIATGAIDADAVAADAVAEIAAGVWDLDATAHQTQGTFGQVLGDSTTDADSVWAMSDRIYTAIAPVTGIINDVAATTTSFKTSLAQVDNFWNDATIVFTTGALTGQARVVSTFANANGVITLDEALTSAPAQNDLFTVRAGHTHTKSQIATTLWQDLTAGSDFSTVGSIGKLLVTDIDAAISSRGTGTALDASGVRTAVGLASANLDTQLSAIAGYIDTEVAAIKAKTDNLPASPAATGDIPTVSQIWTTALTEAYRSAGAAGTAAQLLHEILQNLTEFSITSTTKTVKKFDGSTTAKTYTLDDATAPTSITETT